MWLFVSADPGDRFLRRLVARRYGSDSAEPLVSWSKHPRCRLQPPGFENNVSRLLFFIHVVDSNRKTMEENVI